MTIKPSNETHLNYTNNYDRDLGRDYPFNQQNTLYTTLESTLFAVSDCRMSFSDAQRQLARER